MSLSRRPPVRHLLKRANQYLQGELSAPTVAKQLRGKGPFADWLAGEVLLDQAARGERYSAVPMLGHAEQRLKAVVLETNKDLWRDGYDHAGSRARACMRLTQLDVLKVIHGKERLPAQPLVKGMYDRLLAQGTTMADSVRTTDKRPSAKEVRGALGEVAVLLLAQRFALREVDCKEWLPLQSLFSEDNGGDCLKVADEYAWDMNVFTPVENVPTRTYSLQVKNYDMAEGKPPMGPTLNISPDLELRPNETFIPQKVIAACNLESRFPGDATFATQELDARTEKLLRFFD